MSDRTERKGRTQAGVARQVRVSTVEDSKQLLEMAVGLHQSGELVRARGLYEQIIEREPGHADALHFLGLVFLQCGDAARGAELIRSAIGHKPEVAAYHDNLGSVLEAQGTLDEALEAYRKAEALAGEDSERCFNMGVVLNRLGRIDEAEAAYRKAIEGDPGDPGFHYNLANLLKADGRLEEAVGHYRRAIGPGQDSVQARTNLGNTLQALGRFDEAVLAYREALDLEANNVTAHFNLGNTQRAQSDLDAASASFARVLSLDPGHDDARLALAQVQRSRGQFDAALGSFESLLERDPDNTAALVGLASVLRFVPVERYQPQLCARIKRCFATPQVQAQDLAAASAAQLRDKYALDDGALDIDDLLARVADDALLPLLLTRTINVDAKLERALTRIRAHLLLGGGPAPAHRARLRLTSALAIQCFINEFVFPAFERRAGGRGRFTRPLGAGARRGCGAGRRAALAVCATGHAGAIAGHPGRYGAWPLGSGRLG